jgi:hypothetical protein
MLHILGSIVCQILTQLTLGTTMIVQAAGAPEISPVMLSAEAPVPSGYRAAEMMSMHMLTLPFRATARIGIFVMEELLALVVVGVLPRTNG